MSDNNNKKSDESDIIKLLKEMFYAEKPTLERLMQMLERGAAESVAHGQVDVEQKRRWGIPDAKKVNAVLNLEMLELRRRAARASARSEADKDLAEAEAIEADLQDSAEAEAVKTFLEALGAVQERLKGFEERLKALETKPKRTLAKKSEPSRS